jgi:hypothetical protein
MYVNRCCNFRRRKYDHEISREDSKANRPCNTNRAYVDCKRNVIPVITGTTGTISKSFRKYLSNVHGKHEIKVPKKTAIQGNVHILRKILL